MNSDALLPEPRLETLEDLWAAWRSAPDNEERLADLLRERGADSAAIEKAVQERVGLARQWDEALVAPIAEALEHSGCFSRVEVIGPTGLSGEVTLRGFLAPDERSPAGTVSLRLELEVEGSGSCLLVVDRKHDTGAYPPGSLGAINGFNHPVQPIPMNVRLDDSSYWIGLMERYG